MGNVRLMSTCLQSVILPTIIRHVYCFTDFCSYVAYNEKDSHHIITANEGNAIGLAAGYHLATGKIGLVYLQVIFVSFVLN
jgi:hypothetical protein